MPTATEAFQEQARRRRYLEDPRLNSPLLNHGLQPLAHDVLSRATPVPPNRRCPRPRTVTVQRQIRVTGVRPPRVPLTAYPALPRITPLGSARDFGAVANRMIAGGASPTKRSRNVRPRMCWACRRRFTSCSTKWRSLTRALARDFDCLLFFFLDSSTYILPYFCTDGVDRIKRGFE